MTVADDVNRPPRLCLGDMLAALGRKLGLTDEDIAFIERAREQSPSKPMTFE